MTSASANDTATPGALAYATNELAQLIDADGIMRVPEQRSETYGINASGQLYQYGETPEHPKRVLEPDEGVPFALVLDCLIKTITGPDGQPQLDKDGIQRDYLVVTVCGPEPGLIKRIQLPCGRLQSAPRTLLAGLLAIDLPASSIIMRAKRGTHPDATRRSSFINLFRLQLVDGVLHANPVIGETIDKTRADLEIAVNRVRRALSLEPQF